MTTSTYPRVFRGTPNALTDAYRGPLDLDAVFHEVAETVDRGWQHLVSAARGLEQHHEDALRRTAPIMPTHPHDRSPIAWLSERAAIDLAAEDPSTITSSVAQRHRERLAAELASEEVTLVDKARARLAERASEWLTNNEAKLCKTIQTLRGHTANEIAALAEQLPDDVRTWASIAGHHDALRVFQGIVPLLSRWDALRATHLAILGQSADVGRWTHLDWVGAYERDWPDWYLVDENKNREQLIKHVSPFDFRTLDAGGKPTGVDTVRQARAIAATRYWTPTAAELRAKVNQLNADAPGAWLEARQLGEIAAAEERANRQRDSKPTLAGRVVPVVISS